MSNSEMEGNIKYSASHTMRPAADHPLWEELNSVRTKLHDMHLVGVHEDGIAFGNVSMRLADNQFLISGTSTGSVRELSPDGYCTVLSVDIPNNRIVSAGPLHASSESMTHGAIYQSCPSINCVIHIHNRRIFEGMIQDHCTATPRNAEYGTPEIAIAISECVKQAGKTEGDIVLKGHNEGVISYAASINAVYNLVLNLYINYCK
jgi:ribulose-5-phosphate 4-epimerase/fuculose-1-phosphate aldolase